MSEVILVKYGTRETEKRILSAGNIACGVSEDGTVFFEIFNEGESKAVRFRMDGADVKKHANAFRELSNSVARMLKHGQAE